MYSLYIFFKVVKCYYIRQKERNALTNSAHVPEFLDKRDAIIFRHKKQYLSSCYVPSNWLRHSCNCDSYCYSM